MSFNTGNPIGSISEEDCYDNMANLDQAMNSTDPTWRDRFGVEKPTIDAALRSTGFMPAGFDFVTGGTLQPGDRNKAVYNPAPNGDNNWYRWNGVFPKDIAANSQPNPKDENNWVPVLIKTGTVEREALRRTYQEVGLNLVDGSFEEGGTLQSATDVLLEEKTGKVYSWSGVFPKVVNKGTLPTSEAEFVDKALDSLAENVVGVDGNVPTTIQIVTHRGSTLFTKTTDEAKLGDVVIGNVVYRLSPSNIESSTGLSDTPINGGCGWRQLMQLEEKMLKSRDAPLQITVDDISTNRTLKAWRLAEGICDPAAAGSFMMGYDSEPQTQVIGFDSYDKIGTYQARDSVALFSQVQGQLPIAQGSFNYSDTSVTGPEIQAQWEKIKVGMIFDTNLGNTTLFKGAVIIDKVDPYTLIVSPWTGANGGVVSAPANGTKGVINQRTHLWGLNSNTIVNNGAIQGIGSEIGMMCLTTGSGTNSKVIYAVNLGGEAPEFGFFAKGPFRKGYTALSSEEYAFYSKGLGGVNSSHFRAVSSTGELEYDYGPNGVRYETVDFAYCGVSGTLTTRPLSIGTGNNLVLSLPTVKPGRKLAYKNASGTTHTVNNVTVPSGGYIVFVCDGTTWLTMFKI
ncbi:putative tailspike protein [Aeromonas phage AVP1]|nr:putative tailspike protein [Aeromonas phage AVP1]